MSCVKQKRRSYTAKFKLEVASYAESTNNCVASREFGVNEKMIRDWRKKVHLLKKIPKSKKALRHGSASFQELEKVLSDWIIDNRRQGYVVSRTAIRLRALRLAKDEKFAPVNNSFRASQHWCTRFMNRYGLCLRRRTKISQKMPSDLEEKIMNFQKYVIEKRKITNFEMSQIGNMDETPMTFDLPENFTVDKKGEKTIHVKTTGHEKTRFTVVLTCLANGNKLPPMIVFKRKTLPKGAAFPSGVLVRAQENGWMDDTLTMDWFKNVWCKKPGSLLRKPSLLVWDMFKPHCSEVIKKHSQTSKTTLCVIPGGLTSILQPLDVSINKPFKVYMRKYWTEWIQSDLPTKTKGGNLRKPDITVIAQWVKDAWDLIPAEMIVKSFKKCCISNNLDGTEDDAVYERSDDDTSDESSDDDSTIYDDSPMTEKEFRDLFGNSDSESEFEGF